MRQKSIAMAESLKHHRYAEADVERHKENTEPVNSYRIHGELQRVERATHKEEMSIGDIE
jgi:hypothetical protein